MKGKEKKVLTNKDLKPTKAIPREQWEKHFKLAIKTCDRSVKGKVGKVSNRFDESGWSW